MADKDVKVESKKAGKQPMSFKQTLKIIIIAALALMMVGGVYYIVVLVSQSKAEKARAWGSYDGTPIMLENNSVFYNNLVNNSDLQTAYLNGDYNTLMSVYYGAYQSQVVFTALSNEAKEAGIVAPQELVNKLILSAGIYNGEDGSFSQAKLDAASEADKMTVNNYYTAYYPYYAVLQDLQTSIVSRQEADFVKDIASNTRSFNYFVIDYNAYPNELAEKYGAENADLFAKADISVITASEGNAKTAHEALQAGTAWEDVVATYSTDSYASNGGAVGSINLFAIMGNLSNAEDIQNIKALETGAYTAPIQGPNGYTIYRLNAEIEEADFNNADTLRAVKYYINQNSIDDVTSYVTAASSTASELARTDFDAAAESVNATIMTVSTAANNVGNSQYIGGLSSYDSNGYLAAAASDPAVSKELFTSEQDHVTGALTISGEDNLYVVAKVTAINDADATMSYMASMLYNYYAPIQPTYDRFYNVLSSNKHTDNFYTQFFATVLGSARN